MLQAWALEGIPEVSPGDDLVALIGDALERGVPLADGDIVVVTSKIVSKAEGRILHADDREDAITEQTVRLVASRTSPTGHVTRIVENPLGIVSAAAGVDADTAAPAPPKLELEKITCSNGLVWTADSKKVGVAAAVYRPTAV